MNRLAAHGACVAGFLLLGLLASASMLGAAGKKKPEKPVNLNTATVEELAQLPGIGEVTARRIIRHREKSGKFRSVDELLVVRGISQKKLEALRPYLTVEAGEGKNKN